MKVIIINGPMGVGKTTVGKYIANQNTGTALIDGDWCLDLHPFVGSPETKRMAIDNMVHMVRNYQKCTVCKMVVVVWLMDDKWAYDLLYSQIKEMGPKVVSVSLLCSEEQLVRQWREDQECEWRTEEWLRASIRSLPYFSQLENRLDVTGLSIPEIAEKIMRIPT